MVSQKVKVTNPSGLHLKPAGKVCNTALEFKSHITFQVRTTTANAKSMLSVLGAGVRCGEEILLICEGPDEEAALARMVDLIEHDLGV